MFLQLELPIEDVIVLNMVIRTWSTFSTKAGVKYRLSKLNTGIAVALLLPVAGPIETADVNECVKVRLRGKN